MKDEQMIRLDAWKKNVDAKPEFDSICLEINDLKESLLAREEGVLRFLLIIRMALLIAQLCIATLASSVMTSKCRLWCCLCRVFKQSGIWCVGYLDHALPVQVSA